MGQIQDWLLWSREENGPNSGLAALVSRGKWAKFRIGCFGLVRKMGQIQDWLLWSREENGPNSGLAALVSRGKWAKFRIGCFGLARKHFLLTIREFKHYVEGKQQTSDSS